MHIRRWIQAATFLAAVALPAAAVAQFQPPTPEELSMKAEPKAPGADAVYLYLEETVDDNLHYHSFYARIKVLTEKAKDLATVGVPYPKGRFSVTDIKARTIHADGTVIPLDVKPADLVEHQGTGAQFNRMVFTLPSVEVGSILEYRWELRYDDETLSSPYWEIQQRYFVRKAHYAFLPFRYMERVTNGNGDAANKLLYSAMLPKDVKVVQEAGGRYSLNVEDVAPIPEEEYMPPLGTLIMQVQFYYTPFTSKEDFWKKEGERWSKEMNRFAGEAKPLREAVNGIVSPSDSEDAKARKLYDAVMALDNTDYTRRKSQAELKRAHLKATKSAEDVWSQKSGSSDEIALLYLAMARIAGLKAYAMLVCNRNRTIFNPFFLSMNQFDDVMVLLSIGGKDVPLDPGKKFAPFGEIDWRHSLTSTLRQTDKGTEFGSTPGISYKLATTMRAADLQVDRQGTVKGVVRITMNGPAALRWRELAIENDEDELKKQFNEHVRKMVPEGVNVDFDHFLALTDYNRQLMGILNVSGTLATSTGKRLFLPGEFFESRAKHPFVSEAKRQAAVDMEYPDMVRDEVTYHLPESAAVESAPADTQIPWTGHAAFVLKAVPGKDEITLGRMFARGFSFLDAKEYPELHDFYQKVATADQQQLVLTTAAPAKAGMQ